MGISRFAGSVLSAVLLVPLVAAVPALAAGRITGKVTGPDGEPSRGLALRFVPVEGTGDDAIVVETNRRGRFGFALAEAGPYRVEFPDSSVFARSIEIVVKTPGGVTVARTAVEGDALSSVPPLPLPDRQETELTVVVEPLEDDVAADRALAFASPTLREVADLYQAGELDRALATLEPVLAESPELGEAHYLHGLLLRGLARPAEAERALLRAIESIPDHPGIDGLLGEVRMERADALRERGRAEEAAALDTAAAGNFAQELARDPGSGEALVNRAAALERAGDLAALVPALEAIIERLPDAPEAYLRLAATYSQQGEHELAMETLRRMPGDDARAAVTIYNIAVRQYNDGQFAAAEAAARRAVEIDPELAPAHRLIGESLIARGDRQGAIAPLQRYIALAAPDDPDLPTYRALVDALANP